MSATARTRAIRHLNRYFRPKLRNQNNRGRTGFGCKKTKTISLIHCRTVLGARNHAVWDIDLNISVCLKPDLANGKRARDVVGRQKYQKLSQLQLRLWTRHPLLLIAFSKPERDQRKKAPSKNVSTHSTVHKAATAHFFEWI